jgi:hypothetical protein
MIWQVEVDETHFARPSFIYASLILNSGSMFYITSWSPNRGMCLGSTIGTSDFLGQDPSITLRFILRDRT